MFAPKALAARWVWLIAIDLLIAILAAQFVFAALTWWGEPLYAEEDLRLVAPLLGFFYIIAIYFDDLYVMDKPRTGGEVIVALLGSAIKLTGILGIVMLVDHRVFLGRRAYLSYVVVATALLIIWRLLANDWARRYVSRVMLLAGNKFTDLLAREIEQRSHIGYKLVNVEPYMMEQSVVGASSVFSTGRSLLPGALEHLMGKEGSRTLVVEDGHNLPFSGYQLMKWRVQGLEILDCETFYEWITGKLPVGNLRDQWLLFAPGFACQGWRLHLKRFVDVVAAAVLTVLTLPLMIVTAMCIKLESKGPVFYSQQRVGRDGRIFKILKFRSMHQNAEQATGAVWALRDDTRVTRVGRVIRRLRIDELPQLLNILAGDMSLVGPRPERPEMVSNFERGIPTYAYRHLVRPGLTGWAQVCFSYGAGLEDAKEKLCYDLYYIKNWSLGLDLQIMLQTVKVVLYGRGAR
jgi:sugar transferase (PEP-CTERM system associated)